MKIHINKKAAGRLGFVMVLTLGIFACQKLNQPTMGDYPKDTNPPGGPLKFYAAYDSANVDSIRANFGTPSNITYVNGIKGRAISGGTNSRVVYPSANDLRKATSFTVSFWINKAGPNPGGAGTSFAFGIATSDTIWTYQNMFLEFEDAGNPSSPDLAAAKFYLDDQWFEFTKTATIDKRLPKVLDGSWHHLAFTFDSASSTFTPYVDGAPLTNLPADFGKFTNYGWKGKSILKTLSGLVVGGPGMYGVGKTPTDIGQTWMGDFNGKIDEFRLYGVALSAADISALYTSKQ